MRSIDIHAHLVPQAMWSTTAGGGEWYGVRHESTGDGLGVTISQGRRSRIATPKVRFTPTERMADMDAQGVDMQVLSIHTPLMGYHLPAGEAARLARDVNDEISGMVKQWPKRFAGLATLPVQDPDAAVAELDRAVHTLGLKGAELDTVVNDENWDEPRFLPIFKAAESMGAVLFFHPQPQQNLVMRFTDRYNLANSLGVIVEDTIVAATLIYGGILDACPNLKVCIAHGAGPACFGMGRMDHGWKVRSEAREHIHRPPSTYQRRLYYDTVVGSEAALRFLLDTVGADRVVLGSDWPFVPWDPSPPGWVQGCKSLTQEEKDKILWKNLESLLGL